MSERRVFVLADDPQLRKPLVRSLGSTGFAMYDSSSDLVRTGPLCRFNPEVVVVDLGTSGYAGDTTWRARPLFDALWPREPIVIALSRFLPVQEAEDRINRLRPRVWFDGDVDGSRIAVEIHHQFMLERQTLTSGQRAKAFPPTPARRAA